LRTSFDDSHFLPFTHNPKHDSGGRARQDNYFFVGALVAFQLKKRRIVALYLLTPSKNLLLRSSGEFFFALKIIQTRWQF